MYHRAPADAAPLHQQPAPMQSFHQEIAAQRMAAKMNGTNQSSGNRSKSKKRGGKNGGKIRRVDHTWELDSLGSSAHDLSASSSQQVSSAEDSAKDSSGNESAKDTVGGGAINAIPNVANVDSNTEEEGTNLERNTGEGTHLMDFRDCDEPSQFSQSTVAELAKAKVRDRYCT